MKKILLTAVLASIGINIATVQVGIGTETPDDSAQLELQSTTKGFLPPRMTTAERNAINNGVFTEGLIIYNTDVNCLQWYVGNGIWHNGCGDNVYLKYPEGTVFGASGPTEIVDIISSTGKIWMDRNLGALRPATNSYDYLAFGYFYQWGRGADGHQNIVWTSYTGSDGAEQNNETTTLSSTDQPGHINFILAPNSPYDWRSPQNTDLWQGANGVNNVCPSGYRIPTVLEWQAEINAGLNNADAAFNILKLPVAGRRFASDGSLGMFGQGSYWSSTVYGLDAYSLYLEHGSSCCSSIINP